MAKTKEAVFNENQLVKRKQVKSSLDYQSLRWTGGAYLVIEIAIEAPEHSTFSGRRDE